MSWNFSNDKPIFQQLVDIISADIIGGKYKPGDKLEPVRDLAITAGVNPNTMQRALAAIEETGLIYTRRGDGRYISEDGEKMQSVSMEYVSERTADFITAMRAFGLDGKQILEVVSKQLNNENNI